MDTQAMTRHTEAFLEPRNAQDVERVTVDGMDLVEVRGEHLSRNEVYFDRAALAPLLQPERGGRRAGPGATSSAAPRRWPR